MFNDSKLEMSQRPDVNDDESYVVEEEEDDENQPTTDVLTNAGFYDNQRITSDVIKVNKINFLNTVTIWLTALWITKPFKLQTSSTL